MSSILFLIETWGELSGNAPCTLHFSNKKNMASKSEEEKIRALYLWEKKQTSKRTKKALLCLKPWCCPDKELKRGAVKKKAGSLAGDT